MRRLSGFIRRERLYILLAVFVILVNVIIVTTNEGKAGRVKKHRTGQQAAAARTAVAAKKTTAFEDTAARRAEVQKIFAENRHLAFVFTLTSLLIVAVFLLGIVIDAMLAGAYFTGKRLDITTCKLRTAAWGAWDVAKVMILFLFFGYIIIMIESLLVRVVPPLKDDNIRMILNSSILDTLGVVFILYFTIGQHKEKLASLGLSLKNFARNVFYGIVSYLALIPVLVAVLAAIALYVNMIQYVPEKQPVVELFLKEKNAAFLFYTSIFAAIFGPMIEELFFRGFMYSAFKKRVGIFPAMFITAAMFAALHAHAVGFLPILVLGMLLAYLYEKTGTLVSSITVHIMHNLAMVLLVFLVKQLGVG